MTAQQLEANYACAADTSTAPHLEGMSDSSRSGKKAKEFVLDYLVLDREQCCHPRLSTFDIDPDKKCKTVLTYWESMIKLTRALGDQALKAGNELQLVGNQASKDTLRMWVESVEALRLRAEGWQMKLRYLHGAIKFLERDSDSDEDMHVLYEDFAEAFESSLNDVNDEDIEEGADEEIDEEYYY